MILLIVKGFLIGFFMLFPGMSGGSIAIMLSEYNNIIKNTSTLFKNFKGSFFYLLSLGIGGILGLYFSSFFITFISKNYYNQMLFFFLGIMLAFVISFIKINTKNIELNNMKYILVGAFLSILFNIIPEGFFFLESWYNFFFLGIVLAVALILPGVSFTYVLLIFSCYDKLIFSIKNFDIEFLLKISIALIIGILLTIKVLEKIMNKNPQKTNLVLSGFIIGSFYMFFSKLNSIKEINVAVNFLMIGILFFLLFVKIFKK